MCRPSCPQQVTSVNFIAMCRVIHTCCQSRCFLTAKWGSELLLVLTLKLFPFLQVPWSLSTKNETCPTVNDRNVFPGMFCVV